MKLQESKRAIHGMESVWVWMQVYQADLAQGDGSHVGRLSWHWMSHHSGSAASGLSALEARTCTACHITMQLFGS